MKRREFYKEYYKVTDRVYADFMILTSGDVRTAWDKGWIKISKTERKVMIVLQYLVLLGALVCILLGKSRYGLIGCLWFLLSTRATDFSLIKTELLYRAFHRNTPYAILLHLAFFGRADSFWQLILPETKKQVSGFVRYNSLRLVAVYRVVLRQSRQRVFLIIGPGGVKLRTKGYRVRFTNPQMPLETLAEKLIEALKALPCPETPAAKNKTQKCKRK